MWPVPVRNGQAAAAAVAADAGADTAAVAVAAVVVVADINVGVSIRSGPGYYGPRFFRTAIFGLGNLQKASP